MDLIYLDNNATTPILPEVAETIADCQLRLYGNPASAHQLGRRAEKELEEAREGIAEILGATVGGTQSDQLIFTSGGTESNNLALRGIVGTLPGTILISAIEHPSVSLVADELTKSGISTRRLPVDQAGVVLLDGLTDQLANDTRLVSVILGNHETGVIQPVHELARHCRAAGIPLHTDAAQVIGKIPVDFRSLGAAAMSVSAHKFHGPVGIGALLLRNDVRLRPIIHGGTQQSTMRPGTEPVALAAGMFKALQIWHREADQRARRMSRLRDRLEQSLQRECGELVVHGQQAPRLPHTSNMAFPGQNRQALAMALDLAGVACSTGSACASGSSQPSPVLLAMGLAGELVEGSLRFSLGALTSEAEIDAAVPRILKVYNDLRRVSPDSKAPRPSRTQVPKTI